MLGLSGQLGIGGLGNFRLATVRVGQPYVPHRGPVFSEVAAPGIGASLSAPVARGTLVSAGARSSISGGGPGSSISSDEPESEVSGGG